MNSLLYFTVFAVCFAAICGSGSTVYAAPFPEASDHSIFSHESAIRVVRQAPPMGDLPPPPEVPPPPAMYVDNFSRKKREAKGVGGSMPTRKG